ncbi:hypothetical protein [Roseococcus sp.]|uniref:hypothetical protein n=1 Tax=Roseococcus sp. TaxID=2109646 RepID=UPI003BA92FC7
MYISLGENFQLGIDCVAALSDRRHVVFGWHMTPRGTPIELSFATPDGRFCRTEYISRHARPDVVPPDPGAAIVGGFSLVISAPPLARGIIMTLTSGSQSGRANLSDASINTDLFRGTVERDWGTTFGLLGECRDRPDVLPLMSYQYRPFGAFANWIAQLPLIQGTGQDMGIVSRLVCSTSPAGEILIDLRFTGRSRSTVSLEAVVVARLRSDDGGPDEIVLLPLADPVLRHAPGSSALYGQLGWEHVGRLRSLDVIVQVLFDAERIWLRCQPRAETVPAFLDGIGASPVGRPGQTLLRGVLTRRAAAFRTLVAAEAAGEAAAPALPERALPELVVIGIDDPAAMRLLHLLAPELEAEASSIVLLGAVAETASQIFERRGKIPVEVAEEAGDIMERAALVGADNLVTLGMARLARAAIEGDLSELIRRSRIGGLSRLLMLHAMAGPTSELDESLARHAALSENPLGPWDPISRAWQTAIGAEIVNEHLETMWRTSAEPAE